MCSWIDDGTRNPEDNSLAGRHGNPGKGFQHFDNIFDAWIALFINMVRAPAGTSLSYISLGALRELIR